MKKMILSLIFAGAFSMLMADYQNSNQGYNQGYSSNPDNLNTSGNYTPSYQGGNQGYSSNIDRINSSAPGIIKDIIRMNLQILTTKILTVLIKIPTVLIADIIPIKLPRMFVSKTIRAKILRIILPGDIQIRDSIGRMYKIHRI